VIEAELFIALLLEQRNVQDAIRHVDAAPGRARALHVERLLEELRRGFRIIDDNGDMAELGHG
jgi:hypothetical protein